MSINLETLQAQFSRYVFDGDEEIKGQIVSTSTLKSDLRLAIYANAYVARMLETLECDYPVISALLGDDKFYDLASSYTRKFPSSRPSLRWFGQHLVEYLRSLEQFADQAYITELAELEWLLASAFNANDTKCVAESDVAVVPADKWPELSLEFHPSVYCFSYDWNIIAIWNAVKNEHPIPEFIKLEEQEKCIVWRQDVDTKFRTLEPLERTAIPAMMADTSFAALCELLSANSTQPDEVPIQAAGLLKRWINDGLIVGLTF